MNGASTLKTLNLTFDDGPDMIWTERVVELLRSVGVRATFFMMGERVQQAPDVVRAVVDAGHDVQLHCHRHLRHSQMTADELTADTEAALEALTSAGVYPRLWRPPWGVWNERSARVADRYGLRLRSWSIDTHDWRGDRAEAMLAAAGERIRDGGAVLMHDGLGPGALRDGCQNTLELIPALVRQAREQRLPLTPMDPSDAGIALTGTASA